MPKHFRSNLIDAWNELKTASPAWAEIVLAFMAIVSGSWSYLMPTASEWAEAPPVACMLLFILTGAFQLAAFISRNYFARRSVAACAAANWAGVMWIVWQNNSQGFVYGMAFVACAAQVFIHAHLRKHRGAITNDMERRA
jgi:hypothetical protein